MEEFTVHLDISGVRASDRRDAMARVERLIEEARPDWIVAVHEAQSHKKAFGEGSLLSANRGGETA